MNNYIYSVTQLNNYSSTILRNKLTNVWVKGEISSIKSYPSGFSYFILKDNNAQLSCITTLKNFDNIKEGIKVTLNGDVDLYVPRGSYQIKVHSILPFGQGELWMNYVSLRNKLESEGVFDISKKIDIPKYPKNIGVITSLNGAVINDISNIINRRASYVKIIVRDTKVNGDVSSSDLIKALQDFIDYKDVDVIIFARGGGSFEDLMGFNDETLIRNIYDCNIPVISAVGHETDFTLCDFVADIRASTPSEAAEIVCIDSDELINYIENLFNKIVRVINSRIDKNKMSISKLYKIISSERNNTLFNSKKEKLKYLYSLFNNSLNNVFNKYSTELNLYKTILLSIDIDKIKRMGFAIIKKNNNIVNNINQLNINDFIDFDLNGGKIKSKVKELYEKK